MELTLEKKEVQGEGEEEEKERRPSLRRNGGQKGTTKRNIEFGMDDQFLAWFPGFNMLTERSVEHK